MTKKKQRWRAGFYWILLPNAIWLASLGGLRAEQPGDARAFVQDLFKAPLRENWRIRCDCQQVSAETFARLTKDDAELVAHVAARLAELGAADRKWTPQARQTAIDQMKAAKPFVDRTRSSFLGQYAFSLWFMKFDEDNWFSFEVIRQPIQRYLDKTQGEFVLLKRAKPHVSEFMRIRGVFREDLPVVLSGKERSVAVFVVELFD